LSAENLKIIWNKWNSRPPKGGTTYDMRDGADPAPYPPPPFFSVESVALCWKSTTLAWRFSESGFLTAETQNSDGIKRKGAKTRRRKVVRPVF
jgi:hypothetical protein